jgi:hypothetical protein
VGGEAPVTPVSTFDSSFLTFPTNRAITGNIATTGHHARVVALGGVAVLIHTF